MKNKIIISGLLLLIALRADANASYTYNGHHHHNNNGWGLSQMRPHNHYYGRFPYRNGYLTGFSPPIYNNGIYSFDNGVTQGLYTTGGAGYRIRNWFATHFGSGQNSNYQMPVYSPSNPYVYGNYNPNQTQKSIQLFGAGNMGGGYTDPYGNSGAQGLNSGCNVTIID